MLPEDALLFTDVTVNGTHRGGTLHGVQASHVLQPGRQSGDGLEHPRCDWRATGAHGRTVATLTGDGCVLMSGVEIGTAAREHLPVKFVILDDQAYHYMQMLQSRRISHDGNVLARAGLSCVRRRRSGVAYVEVDNHAELEAKLRGAMCHDGPVLIRVSTDYGGRKIRWIESVRHRYPKELTAGQKARFLARIGSRALKPKEND